MAECKIEDCTKKIYIKKAGMCRSHYEKSKYQYLITAAVPTTAPCSYDAAHQRVRYWRGRPSQYLCVCGSQAEEWSYRNYSEYEMTGQRQKLYPNGTYGWINSRWSTHVKDYDALCVRCHEERDSKI